MQFGMNASQAEEAHAARSSTSYIRYLRNGDNKMWILQEPDEWVYYYEHYNPGGSDFPCTQENDCPGCTSEVEKMQRPSMRVAFNAKQEEYINVIKVPYTVSEKLKNRFSRRGTVLDREYIINKFKVNDRTDYDVEAGDPGSVDVPRSDFLDIEKLLEEAFEDAWGNPDKAKSTKARAEDSAKEAALKDKLDKAQAELPKDPPSEPSSDAKDAGEITVTEEELRAMSAKELKVLCIQEYDSIPPTSAVDEIVDWMLQQA